MHLQLDSRPGNADVSADGLSLRFAGTPGLDVVATLAAPLGATPLTVVVEVLAASHRVHLFDADGLVATEQVACVGDGPAGEQLPASAAHAVGPHRLGFSSERPDLDADAVAELASQLRDHATADDALVVSFPGHPDALTSVRLLADGWETWHLYPGEHAHAVRTRTAVVTA